MKPIFTFDEIREVERKIIHDEHVPSLLLMENAGKNSCDIILKQFPDLDDYRIYIICGKGNNAGDGFVVARQLVIKGFDVNLILMSEPEKLSGDAAINFHLLTRLDVLKLNIMQFDEFRNSIKKNSRNFIIDAILGTGLRGNPEASYSKVIEFINETGKNRKTKIVSLDVPSGLSSESNDNSFIVDADFTLTMGSMKTELLFGAGKEKSGEVYVAPIGIDDNLFWKYNLYGKRIIGKEDIKEIFPRRKISSHKYTNGKVLVVGGSKGLSGALLMSSLSALKSGAGAVVAAFPESLSAIFGRKLFDVMTMPLNETEDGTIAETGFVKFKQRFDWADCVLVGPGISQNESTKKFIHDVVKNCPKNLVIDADALNVLADDIEVLNRRSHDNQIILTPHIGEFSKLCKHSVDDIKKNRFEIAREFSAKNKVNVVLKSETSISVDIEENIYINTIGNQLLATAGSGDILSGIIASVFAQSYDERAAMLCGNYLHGIVAEKYFSKFKNKQTASPKDLIELIPEAVSEIIK